MIFRYELPAIEQAADWLLSSIGSAKVICFHGAMGAGKTTLIQAICQRIGITGSFSSPTFPIINEYGLSSGAGSLYHLDLYRLSSAAEAERAGVVEALYSGLRCFVEWPERVPGILPPDAVHVYLELNDTESRTLRVSNK